MSISEPTTMATDYVLGVMCAYFAWQTWRLGRKRAQASVCFWSAGFAALAVASLTGGTYHGFSPLLSQPVLQGLWKVTIYTVGLANFFLLTGTLSASMLLSTRRFAMPIPYVQLMVYGIWMATHNEFHYVIYNYAFTNLCILALQIHAGVLHRANSAPWLVGGVLVSGLAAVVQVSGIAIHRHVNHNDLYHVIQMGGMYLFYKGAILLTDRK